MITPKLSPIDQATKEEIDLYYEVEETMVKSGDLKISQKELYEDIDAHESIYFLKTHDHFHYFTLLASIGIGWLAYTNYMVTETMTIETVGLCFSSIGMILLSWLITHPTLRYEKEAREYFKTHRTLFLFKD